MRVFIVPGVSLREDFLKYDSSILLASKLGRLAQRRKNVHAYLLAPYDVTDWLEGGEYFSVLTLPTSFRG